MSLPPERTIPLLSPARDVLRRYAAAWAGEAVRAVGKGEGEILIVDAFAGADYPAPAPVLPAMAGAAMLLARGERARHRVLLVEEDPAKVEWLARALADLPVEVREGRAAGVEVDASGPTLLVLDPYSAGDLPLPLLRGWLEWGRVDVLLRFPAADLRRLARHRGSALADLPPHVKRTVEGVSRMLGDDRHHWLHPWTAALAEGPESAVAAIAREHADRLGRDGLPSRRLPLAAADGTEHLLLLSPDPASILLLNQVVHGLREDGALPWPEGDAGPVRYRRRGELALFGEAVGAPGRERVVELRLLADSLARAFAGRRVGLDDLLRSLVDTDLFAGEVRRALLHLRREGRAEFRSLGGGAEIAFPAAGARRMHHRPTRKRAAARQELSLALD